MQQLKRSDMDWDNGSVPEAPSAPENLQQTGLTLGFLNDLILRTLYTRGGMLGLDLARLLCLPFKVIEESLDVPQGREVHRGAGRRPDRPRQLPLQPDRAGPPPRPGSDEAVRLRRPGAGAAGRLRRADLSPGGHRHRRVSPKRCGPPSPTWSSAKNCSTPSARPSSAASRCSSTARPATARPPWPRPSATS